MLSGTLFIGSVYVDDELGFVFVMHFDKVYFLLRLCHGQRLEKVEFL